MFINNHFLVSYASVDIESLIGNLDLDGNDAIDFAEFLEFSLNSAIPSLSPLQCWISADLNIKKTKLDRFFFHTIWKDLPRGLLDHIGWFIGRNQHLWQNGSPGRLIDMQMLSSYQTAFRLFDEDKNGLITNSDLNIICPKLRISLPEAKAGFKRKKCYKLYLIFQCINDKWIQLQHVF